MTWCENGLAFIVRDLNRFCEEACRPTSATTRRPSSDNSETFFGGSRKANLPERTGTSFSKRLEPHLPELD